uniref:STAS/SEC14 domain-containing protein n=1 Tax=Halomonas sp. TaxID=1486246 RepID=UPI0026305DC3|nr:STAS/SEC14 domain-containing protein [Halomonas sp.]
MLELIPHPAAHVVAMRVGGTVTAKDLQQAIDAIEAAKQAHPRVSMLAELDNLHWMTVTAVLKDIGYGLTQFGELKHYHRAAVITDKDWIKHVTHLEDKLIKNLEMRTFPSKEREAAMAWVGELPNGQHETPEEDGYHGA